MKTIALEPPPTETRTLMEGWRAEETSITLSREGFPCAGLTQLEAADGLFDLMPKEENELLEIFRQGDEDFAAGRYITLDGNYSAFKWGIERLSPKDGFQRRQDRTTLLSQRGNLTAEGAKSVRPARTAKTARHFLLDFHPANVAFR